MTFFTFICLPLINLKMHRVRLTDQNMTNKCIGYIWLTKIWPEIFNPIYIKQPPGTEWLGEKNVSLLQMLDFEILICLSVSHFRQCKHNRIQTHEKLECYFFVSSRAVGEHIAYLKQGIWSEIKGLLSLSALFLSFLFFPSTLCHYSYNFFSFAMSH